MSNQSVDSFTFKLLSAKIFDCDVCDKLLTPPVMLVENVGNMCAQCYSVRECKNGVPNKKLEMILKELRIPCKYKNLGCREKILFENLENHQQQCNFQTNKCIYEETCDWSGVQNLLIDHYIHNHSNNILNEYQGVFDVDIRLNEFTPIKLLLRTRKDIFILKIERINNSLVYVICDLKQNSSVERKCTIKHLGQNKTNLEIECEIFQFNKNLSNLCSGKIDLKFIEQVTENTNSIPIQIEITIPNEFKEFNENILQYFDCPICKNLMKPPIFQCKFGHSVCGNCKSRLETCPTCRGIFGTTRNYALEAITMNIPYPCMFKDLGCTEMFFASEANNHESVCNYKPISCPVNNDCSFTGNHMNIVSHLKETHAHQIILSNEYNGSVEFRIEQLIDVFSPTQKYFMIFDDNIFRLVFKRNSDYAFWAVEVLRKCDEKAVFIYEIGIADARKPERKLIRTDTCFSNTNEELLFKKCILFPNNTLSSYANNGVFSYYCRIQQKV